MYARARGMLNCGPARRFALKNAGFRFVCIYDSAFKWKVRYILLFFSVRVSVGV